MTPFSEIKTSLTIRRILLSCLISAALAGCVPYQPTLPPSEWHPAFRSGYEKATLSMKCHWVRETLKSQPNLSRSERGQLLSDLRSAGLIARDIELLFPNGAPQETFGTGMSYNGLTCLGGQLVNQSYDPGLGHMWQVQVGSDYVYLKGNGQAENMRVYSWN